MDIYSYRFRDKRWFQSKFTNFSHHRVFCMWKTENARHLSNCNTGRLPFAQMLLVVKSCMAVVRQWLCGRVPDLQSGGCAFESQPGLLRTKVYSAFHPSGVGKWVPAAAGKAKAGMAHSDCWWTCGCACKTVKSLENTCHTWALLRWWFTMKRRYIKCMHLYLLPLWSFWIVVWTLNIDWSCSPHDVRYH